MAPKSKSGAGNADLKQEDILQAVVFADSFNSNFSPISDDRPRCLFPVANSALLDYTLEFLCAGGIQEIFVLCCHQASQVKQHLQSSRWNEKSSPCTVVPIVSEGCLSMGDALRDIDAKNLIRSDFVLMYGDVVSNIKLQSIIEQHKQRKEKDKSSIMTMVFREVPPDHPTRCAQDDIIVAVDNTTQNVIYYKKLANSKSRGFEFPVEVMTDHRDIQLRYDLLDANISICSPQVPELFKDNFDYETRDSFVRGILINEEIMGNTIQMHIVKDAYAARVSNLQMYDAISQDVLNRWTFPFVPDSCYRHNNDSITYSRHNIYKSRNVTLARECQVKENVLLGSGTTVGSNSQISHCVVGRNCKIGKNVVLQGCYLWDNVSVEDDSTIRRSLLCDGVTVHANSTLHEGVILADNTCVGPNITIPGDTVLVSKMNTIDDFGDELDAPDGGTDVWETKYGKLSKAFEHRHDAACDSDEEEEEGLTFGPPPDRETESSEDESEASSDSGSPEPSLPPDVPVYYTEMLDTIQRSKIENISTDNLILEINSLKHAYNISIKELTGLVVKVILEEPFSENPSLSGPEALTALKKTVTRLMPVLKNYIKTEDSQMLCLAAIEEFGSSSSSHMPLVMKVLHFLYEEDLLLEQAIIRWYRQAPSKQVMDEDDNDEDREAKHREIRKQVAPFITWLEEADEESSDED